MKIFYLHFKNAVALNLPQIKVDIEELSADFIKKTASISCRDHVSSVN
jgi:hypothetical protein